MALQINWIERHLYDADGYTGNTYYIRIVRRRDSKIWDQNSKILKAVTNVTWSNSAIVLVEEGTTGVYPVVIPYDWRTRDYIARTDYGKAYVDLTPDYGKPYADLTDPEKVIVDAQVAQKAAVDAKFDAIKNIPSDTYDIIVYKQSGSFPDRADDIEKQWESKLGGGIFGF